MGSGTVKMVDPTTLKIWTIGHSTRTIEEFLKLLIVNDIEVVADVRSYPGSRRYPHSNAKVLSESLIGRGIDYLLLKELGGRRRSRPDSPNTVWRNEAFRGYADYMETAGFKQAIDTLLRIARTKRTVMMCAEAVWWRCHRSLISDYLKASGLTVVHIIDVKTNVIHPFTAAARVETGKLAYGAAE